MFDLKAFQVKNITEFFSFWKIYVKHAITMLRASGRPWDNHTVNVTVGTSVMEQTVSPKILAII